MGRRQGFYDILLNDGTVYNTYSQQFYSKPIGWFTTEDINGLTSRALKSHWGHIKQNDSDHRIALSEFNWTKAWLLENGPTMDMSTLLPRKGGKVIHEQVDLCHPYISTNPLPSSTVTHQPYTSQVNMPGSLSIYQPPGEIVDEQVYLHFPYTSSGR